MMKETTDLGCPKAELGGIRSGWPYRGSRKGVSLPTLMSHRGEELDCHIAVNQLVARVSGLDLVIRGDVGGKGGRLGARTVADMKALP